MGNGISGEVLLEWKGNPWKSRPQKISVLLTAFFFLYLFLIWAAPELGFFLLVFPLLLLGSEASHLVPSSYTITTEGICQKNLATCSFRRWSEIKSCSFNEEMGELFFHTGTLRSRMQRNMVIYYNDNRTEVENEIRNRLQKCQNTKKGE